MARLVQTHSTYIDGLIKWLKVLQKADGIKTITPGVISSTRGRSGLLTLKISRAIVGGFKVIARKGSLAQEVYIVTELSQSTLQAEIKKANPEGSYRQ